MDSQKPIIYLVPRWAGNIHSDWYDWLVLEISNTYQIDIQCLEMPNWNEPDLDKSLNFLTNRISELNNNTYFIGHSVGCQAILRFLDERLKQNHSLKIGGFLFVAAWFSVDKPWISLKPWTNCNKLNYELLSKATTYKKVILSDNDPFTTDYLENKKQWISRFGAEVMINPGQLHFNRLMEKEILKEVEKMISLISKNKN
ncbi:MAG: hypothetical protein GZ091_02095 [Paludibacter sp.]|nr:hypothetical protein [Paludibacter sp.]